MTNNGYKLTKQWFDFAEANPDKIKPVHGILYLWIVELNNRCKWIPKFGMPTKDTMRMIGITNYNSFKKAFTDLIAWGFIEVVTKSCNQHTANIIRLPIINNSDNSAIYNLLIAPSQHCRHNKTDKTFKKGFPKISITTIPADAR